MLFIHSYFSLKSSYPHVIFKNVDNYYYRCPRLSYLLISYQQVQKNYPQSKHNSQKKSKFILLYDCFLEILLKFIPKKNTAPLLEDTVYEYGF